MKNNQTILFVYRMTADSGLAPCVSNKLLTLACCKGGRKNGVHTGIRYWIGSGKKDNINFNCETDDVYILGTYKNDFLYLAKIKNSITMIEYYSDEQYKKRLDMIYDVDENKLKRNKHLEKEKIHIDKDQQKRDIAGEYVLLSQEYIYFGEDRIKFDKFITKMPQNREVKVYKDDEAKEIINWCLEKNDYKNHKPTDPIKRSCNQR